METMTRVRTSTHPHRPMDRADRIILISVFYAVLTLATACSGEPVTGLSAGDDWWFVTHAKDPEFSRAAESRVTLTFHEDSHCVVGLDDLVVWPAGTEVDPANRVVHFPNGSTARDGDLLLTAGGEAPAPAALDRCAVGDLSGRDLAIWVDSADVRVEAESSK